uniref:Uncharacterized protein n=1 Tax=viral metagenome TaxID=1070528 RepID=A0A6C0C5V0_9ZZZZ
MEKRIAFATYDTLFKESDRFFSQKLDHHPFYNRMGTDIINGVKDRLKSQANIITSILRDCNNINRNSRLPTVLHGYKYERVNKRGRYDGDVFLHMRYGHKYHCSLNTEFSDSHDIPFIDLVIYILFSRLNKIKRGLIREKIHSERSYDNFIIQTFSKMTDYYRETLLSFYESHKQNGKAIKSFISPRAYDQIRTLDDHSRPRCRRTGNNRERTRERDSSESTKEQEKVNYERSKERDRERTKEREKGDRERTREREKGDREQTREREKVDSRKPNRERGLVKPVTNDPIDDFLHKVRTQHNSGQPPLFATRSVSVDLEPQTKEISIVEPIEKNSCTVSGTHPGLDLFHSKKQLELLYVNVIDRKDNKLSIEKVLIYEVLIDAMRNGTHEKFLTYDGYVNFYFIKMAVLQYDGLKIMEVLMNDQMSDTLLVDMIQIKNNGFDIEKVMIFENDMAKIMNSNREDGPRYAELMTFENEKPVSRKVLLICDPNVMTFVFKFRQNTNCFIPQQIERICLFNSDVPNIKEGKYEGVRFQQMLMKTEDNTVLIDVLVDSTSA